MPIYEEDLQAARTGAAPLSIGSMTPEQLQMAEIEKRRAMMLSKGRSGAAYTISKGPTGEWELGANKVMEWPRGVAQAESAMAGFRQAGLPMAYAYTDPSGTPQMTPAQAATFYGTAGLEAFGGAGAQALGEAGGAAIGARGGPRSALAGKELGGVIASTIGRPASGLAAYGIRKAAGVPVTEDLGSLTDYLKTQAAIGLGEGISGVVLPRALQGLGTVISRLALGPAKRRLVYSAFEKFRLPIADESIDILQKRGEDLTTSLSGLAASSPEPFKADDVLRTMNSTIENSKVNDILRQVGEKSPLEEFRDIAMLNIGPQAQVKVAGKEVRQQAQVLSAERVHGIATLALDKVRRLAKQAAEETDKGARSQLQAAEAAYWNIYRSARAALKDRVPGYDEQMDELAQALMLRDHYEKVLTRGATRNVAAGAAAAAGGLGALTAFSNPPVGVPALGLAGLLSMYGAPGPASSIALRMTDDAVKRAAGLFGGRVGSAALTTYPSTVQPVGMPSGLTTFPQEPEQARRLEAAYQAGMWPSQY